jgi:16S rRNA (guanine(527)-N(7))-methyltransferase RsmG
MRSEDDLKQLIEESDIALESETADRLLRYLALLEKWNSRINLTSSTEWRVLGPMFQEGIWAARRYADKSVYHLDIGSGAGFPALLLKILIPQIELDMVESREKKSRFLETVAYALGLSGINVHCSLLSDYLRKFDESKRWDCISWKGLKLGTADFFLLCSHVHSNSMFWMFHGKRPAVEDIETLTKRAKLQYCDRVPGTRQWYLSIFKPL